MTEPNWLARSGATPGKLAAVGALGVVLVIVLWSNLAPSRSTAARKPRHTPSPAKAEKQPAPAVAAQPLKLEKKVQRNWPKLSLDNVVKHDPFAMPMWYLTARADEQGTGVSAIARSAQVLEELKKQQTRIVVISGEERIATIGELSFRVGDMIEGFEVTAITTDGVVLTEVDH
jgi:hypothetical protein